MKIWAISDLHFSHCGKYDMRKYGKEWNHHKEHIINNWRRKVSGQDIVLIPGDISWEYEINTAYYDLKILADLPGRYKIMVRGNHDIWWRDTNDVNNRLPTQMISLSGDTFETDEFVFCGTMGWTSPNDLDFDSLDRNRFEKELRLMETSLSMAKKTGKKIMALLHYPPFTSTGEKNKFFYLLQQYGVFCSVYGHYHKASEWNTLPNGDVDGIHCRLVTTVFLNHVPAEVAQGSG